MVNIKELKRIQHRYNYDITDYEVKKANTYIELMKKERENATIPVAGDIVKYTDKYGIYYEFAHIDKVLENEVYICEQAYVPFIGINSKGKICFSTSGGSWSYKEYKNFKKVGTQEKRFCDWGNCGACQNGAFDFIVEVNVWEYSEVAENEPTTKTHHKYCVTELAEERRKEHNDYKYLVSEQCYNKTAFRTDEEYENWKNELIIDKVEKTAYENTIYLWVRK